MGECAQKGHRIGNVSDAKLKILAGREKTHGFLKDAG